MDRWMRVTPQVDVICYRCQRTIRAGRACWFHDGWRMGHVCDRCNERELRDAALAATAPKESQ